MKRKLVNGTWRGRITRYPGTVRFWYEIRERKSTQQTPLPAPATPSAPSWMRYVYDDIAYMTHNGRLIAWASVVTPTQETRIDAIFQRLVTHTTQQGVTHD